SPRMWYADPAGRTEIEECRSANLKVRRGINDIRAGIAAVSARIRTGRLKVHCPNCLMLFEEARLALPTPGRGPDDRRKPNRREQPRARRSSLPDLKARCS